MPKLLLVRHGEPVEKGLLLGRRDPGLSETGHRVAREQLALLEAAIAYVSPLRRAQETASYLPAQIPRVTLDDLPEIGLGEWEGLNWNQVEERWPDVAKAKLERWWDIPAPGGETRDEVFGRAQRALDRVAQGPYPAIIVAHHGINGVLRSLLTQCDPHIHKQAYCEVFCHEF